MIQLSRRLFHAVEAVVDIAYNGGSEPLSGKDIATRQGMPPRYLEQILQRLVRVGILRGVRGPRGGYLLAREKRRITVADICNALGEEDELAPTTRLGGELLSPLAQQARRAALAELETVTLAVLCDQASEHRIPRAADASSDFMI